MLTLLTLVVDSSSERRTLRVVMIVEVATLGQQLLLRSRQFLNDLLRLHDL